MNTADLKTAYDHTALNHLGISFEQATHEFMFKMCLTRIAEALAKPYIPLPKHEAAKPLAYKD